jgi:mono/diheme cytochrome c family protein
MLKSSPYRIGGLGRMTPSHRDYLRESAPVLLPLFSVLIAYVLVAGACDGPVEEPSAYAPSPPPQFLARKYPANADAESIEYYQQIGVLDPIDPTQPGPKATLEQWKTANGFVAGVTDVTATYFNEFDLRFGREMHCIASGAGKVACYVTNYGQKPNGDPGPGGPQDLALRDAVLRANPVATVAMEYDPAEGTSSVQFYVYNGAGNYVAKAELDSQGFKAVPGICQNCHGGNYNTSTNLVEGANFLPFDVFSFEYTLLPGYSRTEQEESFRELNRLVKQTQPSQAIRDLIDGMYPGGVDQAGSVASSTYVPPGWIVPDDPNTPDVNESNAAGVIYNLVVRPYCRTCHIATDPARNLSWTSYEQFRNAAGLIKSDVCGSHVMPHAEVTWLKFWKTRPIVAHGVLRDFFYPGQDTGDCGKASAT